MTQEPKIGIFLDDEEAEFIESFENSKEQLVGALTPERRKEIQSMAWATMNNEREKISLRISRTDLARLKSRAMQEGIPYQTLINSIIHKYVSN
jgi:predicted DNA binding CopG/RHH family protein